MSNKDENGVQGVQQGFRRLKINIGGPLTNNGPQSATNAYSLNTLPIPTPEKKFFCRNFNSSEGCKFKDKCKFVHEAKSSGKEKEGKFNFKTKSVLCKNFESGKCNFGEKCNFAHGGGELKKLYREVHENDSKSNIVYVRHGETKFNEFLKTNNKKEGFLKPEEIYMDCGINEESLKQAMEHQEKFNKYNAKYCFSSPLLRCLETAFHALSGRTDKDKVTIYVMPVLSEHLSCSPHNVCLDIENKKKRFNTSTNPSFDWTFFDEYIRTNNHTNENLYYLDFITKTVTGGEEIIEKMKEKYCPEHISLFLTNYVTQNLYPECFNSVNKRCKKFKAFLKDFVEQNKVDVSKEHILVFTHSAVIKLSSSKIARDTETLDFFPSDSIYPSNFDTVHIDLD
jgi:broad specificity phosphatase PhoE